MNTTVFHFIEELGKCSHNPLSGIQEYTYNGIFIKQGTETYTLILNEQFTQFKNDVIQLDENKLKVILNELYCKKEQYFDVPTDEVIESMKHDYQYSQTRSFKQDIEMAIFAHEMSLVQKWFINEAIKFVSSLLPTEETNEAVNPHYDTEPESKTTIKQWMTIKEAAAYVGYAYGTIKNRPWQEKNNFPRGGNFSDKQVFNREDLDEWLKQRNRK